MEDTFNVRVDKIFGSLGGDAPSSAGISPSLWRLTDEEIERRQWNLHKKVDRAEDRVVDDSIGRGGKTDMRDQFEADLRDLSDLEQEEEREEENEEEDIDGSEKKRRSSGDVGTNLKEFFDIRANIGRDCTLDYEEEEDAYDKVAVGTEQSSDCLYTKDIKYTDYEVDEFNTYDELPTSFHSVVQDPRANHLAAKTRLKEDAEPSQNFDSLHLSDNSVARRVETEDLEKGESDVDNPKPILKKREDVMESRSLKRVRFSFDTKNGSDNEEQPPTTTSDSGKGTAVSEQISDSSQYSSGVPDYVRNPSNYTLYMLDSTDGDMDDQANQKAYLDFLQYVRGKEDDEMPQANDISVDNPTSVMFTLKKKPGGDSNMKSAESNIREDLVNKGISIGIEDDEESRMDEDEPCAGVNEVGDLQKPGCQVRQYRSRMKADVDDNEESSTLT